ncbi:SDR family NAD(P)-dependent oxidoreductase [Demequina sp.]|uniref:SDR family NAD(P)-dependent oxidoreductase n=1 Tax=Demequina sp. TaxID=2050685 RepID=UPI003A8A7353
MSRIFITGSSQGIGAECARQLIAADHEVVLHARDAHRAQAATAANPGAVAVLTADLASLTQTRALASAASEHGPYDAIIHNAGMGATTQRELTEDGLERIFQVNVASAYVLTALLPVAPRMVFLTSGLEADGTWTPEDLDWATRAWDGRQAYADSKLHDSMLAFHLAGLHPESAVNVVDPGWIRTELGGPDAWDEVDQGADTQVWLAVSDEPTAQDTGRYLKRRAPLSPNPIAREADARAELISRLERATGIALQ